MNKLPTEPPISAKPDVAPSILLRQFDNGLVLVGEPVASLESTAFTFLVQGGSVTDPEDRAGVCDLTCDMLMRGAGERDGFALINELDNLGVAHGEGVNSSYMSLSGATLADKLLPALDMYADVLLRPRLPADKLEAGRQAILLAIDAVEDDPVQKMIEELRRMYFPHPYGRPVHGTRETVENISLDDVRACYGSLVRPNGTILGVAGRFDWDALCRHVEKLLGKWPMRDLAPVVVGNRGPRQSHLHHASNQTHIGIAYPSVPYSHPDYFLASAGVGVLGSGMSSRLFTHVREREGLCYAVFASYFTTRESGGVYCYGASSPKVAQRTLDLMLRELRRLPQGIDGEELDRLKARVLSGLVMQQESSRARSGSIVMDYYYLARVRTLAEVEAIITGLSVADVNRYLAEHPPDDLTVVTIGPAPLEVKPNGTK
ncbi:MAG: insulinase family protein [Planctomycetia bacterium]|nr:insulinase family protein [Planctomycetia bacterium]